MRFIIRLTVAENTSICHSHYTLYAWCPAVHRSRGLQDVEVDLDVRFGAIGKADRLMQRARREAAQCNASIMWHFSIAWRRHARAHARIYRGRGVFPAKCVVHRLHSCQLVTMACTGVVRFT